MRLRRSHKINCDSLLKNMENCPPPQEMEEMHMEMIMRHYFHPSSWLLWWALSALQCHEAVSLKDGDVCGQFAMPNLKSNSQCQNPRNIQYQDSRNIYPSHQFLPLLETYVKNVINKWIHWKIFSTALFVTVNKWITKCWCPQCSFCPGVSYWIFPHSLKLPTIKPSPLRLCPKLTPLSCVSSCL